MVPSNHVRFREANILSGSFYDNSAVPSWYVRLEAPLLAKIHPRAAAHEYISYCWDEGERCRDALDCQVKVYLLELGSYLDYGNCKILSLMLCSVSEAQFRRIGLCWTIVKGKGLFSGQIYSWYTPNPGSNLGTIIIEIFIRLNLSSI
jgi:hypothetical protein